MKIKWIIPALVILLLSIGGGSVFAMSSSNHDIPVSSINSGGEAHASPGYQLQDATGQNAFGNSIGSAHRLEAGYIPMVIPRGDASEMIITSCDGSGAERNQFLPGETVYVQASGLTDGDQYDLWIQANPVADGQPLESADDPSGAQENVTVDAGGGFFGQPIAVWEIPADDAVTYEEWDIVADKIGAGTLGTYDEENDIIDSIDEVGITAPVPELPTVLLLGMGLMVLSGLIWMSRHRRLVSAE